MYTYICVYLGYIYTHTPHLQCWHRYFCNDVNDSGSYRIKWLGQMVPTVQLDAETPKTDAHIESKYFFLIKDFGKHGDGFLFVCFSTGHHWCDRKAAI